MTVLATDTQRVSNLVTWELEPSLRYSREVITYNGVAKKFAIGQLVAVDGTAPATAAAIYGVVIVDKDAPATTATKVTVIARTAILSEAGITLGALALADVKAQLIKTGVKVISAV